VVDSLTGHGSSMPADAFELLMLDQLPGVGPVKVRKLVVYFGSAGRALSAPTSRFTKVAGAAAAAARVDAELRRRVEAALLRAERLGMHVVTWTSPEYPVALRHLSDPPPVLFMRGRMELLERVGTVTVVGARRATERARDVAERLGASLARSGVSVASGLALGVDGAVHGGVLRAGGDAIAVLGTGPDVVYPRSHRTLFRHILDQGLLVSEFLPGTGAAPYHFPRRNRILAALGSTVVVVEAGRRSGSLITVDHALDMGRDVWVVPGPIESSTCEGSNRLLGEGARPLLAIPDFVETVAGEASPRGGGESKLPTSGPEMRILAVLANDALLADELAARVGLPIATALALLTTMELHGEVERMPGMRFRRAA
jgi:DNA processing protein